jgi:hypothetical protein
VTNQKSGPPGPPGPPFEPSWLATLGPAVAEALPMALEVVLTGMRTRANVRTAVQAIEAGHALRSEACDYLEYLLQRYGRAMSPDVRDAYFIRLLELTDPAYYQLPWNRGSSPKVGLRDFAWMKRNWASPRLGAG